MVNPKTDREDKPRTALMDKGNKEAKELNRTVHTMGGIAKKLGRNVERTKAGTKAKVDVKNKIDKKKNTGLMEAPKDKAIPIDLGGSEENKNNYKKPGQD